MSIMEQKAEAGGSARLQEMKGITLSAVRATLMGNSDLLVKYASRNIRIDMPFSNGNLQSACLACQMQKKLHYKIRFGNYYGKFLDGAPPVYQYRGHGAIYIQCQGQNSPFKTIIDVSATWVCYLGGQWRLTRFSYECCMPDTDGLSASDYERQPALYFVDKGGIEVNETADRIIDLRWRKDLAAIDFSDRTAHLSNDTQFQKILNALPSTFVYADGSLVLNTAHVCSCRKNFVLMANGAEWSITEACLQQLKVLCPKLFSAEKDSDDYQCAWCVTI